MYKVPIEVLKTCKTCLIISNKVLSAFWFLRKQEISDIVKKNKKTIKLLEDNYGI